MEYWNLVETTRVKGPKAPVWVSLGDYHVGPLGFECRSAQTHTHPINTHGCFEVTPYTLETSSAKRLHI